MTCEHLIDLEHALVEAHIPETFRGQAWSENCREWVYYHCVLDLAQLRQRYPIAACVQDHRHIGTHDGSEQGLVCSEHHDGIMGVHPQSGSSAPVFPGR